MFSGVSDKAVESSIFKEDEETLVRVEEGEDTKTSVASRQKNKYVGNRSEENRFIRNDDL